MFSVVAVMAFSVSSMGSTTTITDDFTCNMFSENFEENLEVKKLDCNKTKAAKYNAAIGQNAGHFQATFVAAAAWVSCESSNGLWL